MVTLKLQMERWKNGKEEKQEEVEEEQKKQVDQENDDNKENVARVAPAKSMSPCPTIPTADTPLPCCSSLPCSSEDAQHMRASITAMTNNSVSWQSRTFGPVREAFMQSPASQVCKDGEKQSPDCLLERAEALQAQKASTHAELPGFTTFRAILPA